MYEPLSIVFARVIKDATNIVPGEGEREGMEKNPPVNMVSCTKL